MHTEAPKTTNHIQYPPESTQKAQRAFKIRPKVLKEHIRSKLSHLWFFSIVLFE